MTVIDPRDAGEKFQPRLSSDVPSGEPLKHGSVSFVIKTIQHHTENLTLLGLYLVWITVANAVVIIAELSVPKTPFIVTATIASSILSVTSILVAFVYDLWRKRGSILFDEVSDELHWSVSEAKASTLEIQEETAARPDLKIRIALRNFVRSSDLPLLPGKFGPAIYVGVNLVLLLVAAALKHFSL